MAAAAVAVSAGVPEAVAEVASECGLPGELLLALAEVYAAQGAGSARRLARHPSALAKVRSMAQVARRIEERPELLAALGQDASAQSLARARERLPFCGRYSAKEGTALDAALDEAARGLQVAAETVAQVGGRGKLPMVVRPGLPVLALCLRLARQFRVGGPGRRGQPGGCEGRVAWLLGDAGQLRGRRRGVSGLPRPACGDRTVCRRGRAALRQRPWPGVDLGRAGREHAGHRAVQGARLPVRRELVPGVFGLGRRLLQHRAGWRLEEPAASERHTGAVMPLRVEQTCTWLPSN
mmetsp:Transcript_32546/g.93721  ORF Transcript_32546/g.93721 Transcript_32546/m.93721 type:complete len:295 (+) Transcript_32546:27-911(+)